MAVSSAHLLSLLLLTLPAVCWAWRSGGHSYTQSDASPSDYAHGQGYGNDDQYHQGRPPPRVQTGYGDTGTRPGSDAWNRAERPHSQFDYNDKDFGQGKKAEMESLDCGKDLYISTNQIIDIQTSVQYGAQLLDGIYSYSFDGCVEACCHYDGCDLALYKVDGVSETGKTCYFVHCGLQDHCKMVPNNGFKAGFLIKKPDYGEILDDHSSKSDEQESTTPAPETSPTSPPSPSTTVTTAPPTTQTTPTTEQVVVSTETTERPESTTVPPATVTDSKPDDTEKPTATEHKAASTSDTPTQPSSEGNISSSVATGNTPPTSLEAVTDSTTASGNTSKVAIDNATRAQKTGKDYDECAKNGCDGSGLIAVSIIGTLIIIILLVVAAVIGRRIYKLKTRRQYRNVDYLINGMYT